jgi:hypothetical protein
MTSDGETHPGSAAPPPTLLDAIPCRCSSRLVISTSAPGGGRHHPPHFSSVSRQGCRSTPNASSGGILLPTTAALATATSRRSSVVQQRSQRPRSSRVAARSPEADSAFWNLLGAPPSAAAKARRRPQPESSDWLAAQCVLRPASLLPSVSDFFFFGKPLEISILELTGEREGEPYPFGNFYFQSFYFLLFMDKVWSSVLSVHAYCRFFKHLGLFSLTL